MASFEMDFSPIGKLYQTYQQGEQQRQTQDWLQQQGLPGNLSLAQLALQQRQQAQQQANSDRSFGLQEKQFGLAQSQANRREQPEEIRKLIAAGIDPMSAEGRKALFPRTDTPISATDKKAVFEAEDELPKIQGTIESLQRAKELNDKTFTGVTAGARGFLGASVPGGGMLVDREGAVATKEFGDLMSGEAIKQMAQTLKGATTDFEMRKFESILANPTTPPEIRGRVIDRMITLAERQKTISEARTKDLRTGAYFKPQGQSQSGGLPRVATPADAAKLPKGTRFLDPNGVERVVP